MDYKKIIEDNKEYVRQLRRYFHQYPELSFEEVETTKAIAKELDKLGIDYEINPEKNTGIVATICTNPNGKRIMLRGDIDALNVTEKNDFDFKSKNEGKMHACGHDGHIAILLGAAKILKEMEDQIDGTVYFVFQPAEEVGRGAQYMINFSDWYEKTDAVFGGHVWSGLETGKINCEPGPRMAAADMFTIKVHGKSGHGAQPHQTVDATVVAASLVMNLQTLVSRKYNPLDELAVTIGALQSGQRFNIISGEAHLEGTIRYFSPEIAKTIEENMRNMIEHICAAYGATYEFDYHYIVPATINDEQAAELGQRTIVEVLGEDALSYVEKTTGGEDFAYFMKDKPGAFVFVGTNNPEKGADYAHHNERFNMDDDVLSAASMVYAKYAINYLNENK
ncbi:MAG: amidohydrolase [Tissierellia bacterium]|nr:amidohydrolase [Tissierellia bacterium]